METNQTLEERVTKEVTTFTSKIFTLKTRDFLKGLWITVLSQVVTVVMTSWNAGKFELNWEVMKVTATSAFLAYLAKNFFEPTKTVVLVDPAIKGVSTEEKTTTVSVDEKGFTATPKN